jgi:hypothetical protein
MAHLCCCPLLFNFSIQPDRKENVCLIYLTIWNDRRRLVTMFGCLKNFKRYLGVSDFLNTNDIELYELAKPHLCVVFHLMYRAS